MSELEDKINSLLSSPEDMEKITKLAQSFMGGGGEQTSGTEAQPNLASMLGGLDPGMLASIGKIMSKAGTGSDKSAMLSAMGPYLGEKRREKMAKAIQIARIAKLAGTAFSEYGEKE